MALSANMENKKDEMVAWDIVEPLFITTAGSEDGFWHEQCISSIVTARGGEIFG